MPRPPFNHLKILVTANDTGVGKTWVSAQIVKQLHEEGLKVAYTKPVETGCVEGEPGDAAFVKGINPEVPCFTGIRFQKPLAPLAAAAEEGQEIGIEQVLAAHECEEPVSAHVIEGAGGVSVPLDKDGSDWKTFAEEANVSAIVVVVEDRLGAINQTRLTLHYLASVKFPVFVWLNRIDPNADFQNTEALQRLDVPLITSAKEILNPKAHLARFKSHYSLDDRLKSGELRSLSVHNSSYVNLASNDYLGLSTNPELIKAAKLAAEQYGTSASASPLITGYKQVHSALEQRLCDWYGSPFDSGLIWNSGFQANRSILSILPQKGDVLLADKLIHRSLVAGALQSGLTFQRYRHLDLDHLESLLKKYTQLLPKDAKIWVITESLFSMDGDYPDFGKFAELKTRYPFIAIVDEAHALGWYGDSGSGLLEHFKAVDFADIIVGTFGKALASQGAFTLFRDPEYRELLVNFSEDFIYSTYLSPISTSVALNAIDLVSSSGSQRLRPQNASRDFRKALQSFCSNVPDGTSPIIPVQMETPEKTRELYEALLDLKIQTGFIRPPTVPPGSTRLRISLNAKLDLKSLAEEIVQAAS